MAEDKWEDAELHNWSLFDDQVTGRIFNDSKGRFEDGTEVRTSSIVAMGNGKLMTRNTKYKLVNSV